MPYHVKQAVCYLNELPLLSNGVVISDHFVSQVVKRKQEPLIIRNSKNILSAKYFASHGFAGNGKLLCKIK